MIFCWNRGHSGAWCRFITSKDPRQSKSNQGVGGGGGCIRKAAEKGFKGLVLYFLDGYMKVGTRRHHFATKDRTLTVAKKEDDLAAPAWLTKPWMAMIVTRSNLCLSLDSPKS